MMHSLNATVDFLEGLLMHSGPFVFGMCCLAVLVALRYGWLYGPRYVKLVERLWAESAAELKQVQEDLKGKPK